MKKYGWLSQVWKPVALKSVGVKTQSVFYVSSNSTLGKTGITSYTEQNLRLFWLGFTDPNIIL